MAVKVKNGNTVRADPLSTRTIGTLFPVVITVMCKALLWWIPSFVGSLSLKFYLVFAIWMWSIIWTSGDGEVSNETCVLPSILRTVSRWLLDAMCWAYSFIQKSISALVPYWSSSSEFYTLWFLVGFCLTFSQGGLNWIESFSCISCLRIDPRMHTISSALFFKPMLAWASPLLLSISIESEPHFPIRPSAIHQLRLFSRGLDDTLRTA